MLGSKCCYCFLFTRSLARPLCLLQLVLPALQDSVLSVRDIARGYLLFCSSSRRNSSSATCPSTSRSYVPTCARSSGVSILLVVTAVDARSLVVVVNFRDAAEPRTLPRRGLSNGRKQGSEPAMMPTLHSVTVQMVMSRLSQRKSPCLP